MGNAHSRAPPTPPPPPPESSTEAQLYLEHLYSSVFENDLLIEKILSILLLQKPAPRLQYGNSSTSKLSQAEARILRQVSRRWNLTVISIFLQCRQPLLHLLLTYSIQYRILSLVDGFGRSTLYSSDSDSPSSSRHSLPPFSLRVERGDITEYPAGYVGTDNLSLFEKLVGHLNGTSSLIQLHIQDTFFTDGHQTIYEVPAMPGNLRFGVLQNITVYCTFIDLYDRYEYRYINNKLQKIYSKTYFDTFVQSILDRSPELQEVSFNEKWWSPRPVHLFPQTLKLLQVSLNHDEFVRNMVLFPLLSPLQPPLHHLTILELHELHPTGLDRLYKILGDPRLCASSLEHLSLQNSDDSYWTPALVDLAQFPVFPRLKTLTFGDRSVLLGNHAATEVAIEAFLTGRYDIPRFAHPLNGWGHASSRCPALTSLELHLGQLVVVGARRDPSWRPISLETMTQIQSSFGCVTHLSIEVSWWVFLEGSRNLFGGMGAQLKSLTVNVDRYHHYEGRQDDLQYRRQDFDALFLGITPQMAKRLRWQSRRKWSKFLEDQEALRWSIRNLTSLQKFKVNGELFRSDGRGYKLKTGSVSELALRLAFLQMPSLRHLTLGGSFAVSKKCVRLWSESGGGERSIDNQL